MIPRARTSGGYVLFLTGIVVAILALILITSARVQGDVGANLRALQRDAEQETLAQSAAAQAAFLLLTEPKGPRSVLVGANREIEPSALYTIGRTRTPGGAQISEWRMDGRFYALDIGRDPPTRVWISAQDEQGLLDVNSTADAAMSNLLRNAGVSERNARGLAAALGDYVDPDDDVRADGAERQLYARARLPAPANRRLSNVWQALDVLGWRDALSSTARANSGIANVWQDVHAGSGAGEINPNTAPFDVLVAALGDARAARDVVDQREAGGAAGMLNTDTLTGIATRADGVLFANQPGTDVRLAVGFGETPDTARRIVVRLTLAGADGDRPVYVRGFERGVAEPSTGQARGQDQNRNQVQGNEFERLPRSAALFSP